MKLRPREILLATGAVATVLLVALLYLGKRQAENKAELFASLAAEEKAPAEAAAPPPALRGAALLRRQAVEGPGLGGRLAGIQGLASLPPDGHTVALLTGLARDDPEPQVRQAALEALGELGMANVSTFVAALERGGADALGAQAGLLSQGAAADVSSVLVEALRHGGGTAQRALEVARELPPDGRTDVLRVYRSALRSRDEAVVAEAVRIVRTLPEKERRRLASELRYLTTQGPPAVRMALADTGEGT